jgi:putative Ca2+/H+ antiporter (TMEM165/GDT1 family)
MFSLIYGDNVVYQFCEQALVGFTAAHLIVYGYSNIVNTAVKPLVSKGVWLWIVPIAGGLALFCQFFKGVSWVSRLPLAFMVGGAAGVSVQRAIESEFMKQFVATATMDWKTPASAIYILCVLLTLSYFVVSLGEKSQLGKGLAKLGNVGQHIMMVAFGASLGVTVASRISFLIGRMQFLLGTWLGIIK